VSLFLFGRRSVNEGGIKVFYSGSRTGKSLVELRD
jgi:hypothetical protein